MEGKHTSGMRTGVNLRKTDHFFIIHNFNTVPSELLEYSDHFMIYDASTDETVRQEMEKKGIPFQKVVNTGHNITSYFHHFATYYEELPEVLCLCKGNMIGRHCSKEYFDKVCANDYFTYLYEDASSRAQFSKTEEAKEAGIAFLVSESKFVEKNTSWYVESPNHPHKYFDDFDDLLTFIYKDPIIPRYCMFSPGACYIVRRDQIKKHSPQFYENLCKLMDYGLEPNFPSEAHQIERMLPLIFEALYEEQDWMNDSDAFDQKLLERLTIMEKKAVWERKRLKRLRRFFGEKP